jgi:glycosyltransferase involved in cell wall biosynthesis
MKRAGALVIPSLWYEAFPHTILEASACGVPIIASRLGTLPDVIDDEITGLLFEPGKSADLAAKIGRIFSKDGGAAMREKLGAGARAKFLREYTADHAYESLMQIYADAIGRRTALPRSTVPARS